MALPGDGPVLVPVGHGVLDAHPPSPGAGRGAASLRTGVHDLGDIGRVHPVLVIVSSHQWGETRDLLPIFIKLKAIVFYRESLLITVRLASPHSPGQDSWERTGWSFPDCSHLPPQSR